MGCCMASYRSQCMGCLNEFIELGALECLGASEAQWERSGGLELDPVLGSGAVVLMDAKWMVRRARTGGVLEPRQALPPTAFMPHSAVKFAIPLVPVLHIACISHCWLQANHPDPRGHNLRIVGQALQLLSAQILSRTMPSAASSWSKEALGSLGSFYSHPATVVFMLTRFPDDYGDAAKYTRSGNTEQYFNRGWCFCESSWAMLTKPSCLLLDLGRSTGAETDYGALMAACATGRRAPLLPDAFDVQLQSKGFTNGKDDRPRVAELYRSAFAQRFEAAEAQQLAAVLASGAAPRLQGLDLHGNRVGDEGAERLAEALSAPGALPRLQWITLFENRVGDEGAARLAEALRAPGALPRLQELYLFTNRVGDEGAARLAEALRAPGALPRLQLLSLKHNLLGGPGRAALRAAWAEAGRPVGGLVLD
ncbi:unnamed protein product [Prorocentrum cordatum]|uniref:Protein NLRC3 n=1 Tax=Prorocentrum cordatum TaxID=2364126 RepID=A0ABN9SBN6_9DINO|nr:unnamed protein product [Polarella glacialis]